MLLGGLYVRRDPDAPAHDPRQRLAEQRHRHRRRARPSEHARACRDADDHRRLPALRDDGVHAADALVAVLPRDLGARAGVLRRWSVSTAVLWSTMRSFGRWPAAIVGSALVCFGGGGVATQLAGGLATVFALDAHANSLITAAVVGAALVWIVPRIAQLSDAAAGVRRGLRSASSAACRWPETASISPGVLRRCSSSRCWPRGAAPRTAPDAWSRSASARWRATLLTSFVFAAIMRARGDPRLRPVLPRVPDLHQPSGPDHELRHAAARAAVADRRATSSARIVTARSELEILSAGAAVRRAHRRGLVGAPPCRQRAAARRRRRRRRRRALRAHHLLGHRARRRVCSCSWSARPTR